MSVRKRPEPADEPVKRLEKENKRLLHDIDGLKRSEDRFRRLVEETSDLIWEIDENGFNTYMSPKIKDVLGYEPEELVGKRPFDFMIPEEAQFLATVFAAIARARKRFSFSCLENINVHKDGHRVILETSAVPFFGPDDAFKGYRGIDRDITRRKQAEEELKKTAIGLQDSLDRARLRNGLLPLCASCKRIRTEKGWEGIEKYIAAHSEAEFSDSICGECAKRLYPGVAS